MYKTKEEIEKEFNSKFNKMSWSDRGGVFIQNEAGHFLMTEKGGLNPLDIFKDFIHQIRQDDLEAVKRMVEQNKMQGIVTIPRKISQSLLIEIHNKMTDDLLEKLNNLNK